jgi:ADP-ribosylglycohydrolase
MENFIAWCTRDEYTPAGEMFDIGKTCMTAIRNYLATDGKPALECGLTDERSNGNGSLMRIHPMALYLYYKGVPCEEAIEIIHNTSAITHAHPRSKIACGIYSFILWELMDKHNKYAVFMGLNKARKYYNLRVDDEEKRWIRKILSSPELSIYERNQLLELLWSGIDVKEAKGVSAGCTEDDCIFNSLLFKRLSWMYYDQNCIGKYKPVTREEISSTGYVVDTLEAAIWCLMTTDSYTECVLKAVNLGEDTDTVAAVAGGLAGALYGYEAIPESWRNTLIKRDFIEEMCERAQKNWI